MPRSPSAPRTVDIRLETFVRAAPETVYRSLTSARELCVWWLDRAETDARNMGRLRMVWPQACFGTGSEAKGVFVDLEPARKVAWLWDARARRRECPALISFHIEKKPRGAQVTLVHAGFASTAAGRKLRERCREGWEDCLAKMRLYLESGKTCKADRLTFADLELLRRKGRSRK